MTKKAIYAIAGTGVAAVAVTAIAVPLALRNKSTTSAYDGLMKGTELDATQLAALKKVQLFTDLETDLKVSTPTTELKTATIDGNNLSVQFESSDKIQTVVFDMKTETVTLVAIGYKDQDNNITSKFVGEIASDGTLKVVQEKAGSTILSGAAEGVLKGLNTTVGTALTKNPKLLAPILEDATINPNPETTTTTGGGTTPPTPAHWDTPLPNGPFYLKKGEKQGSFILVTDKKLAEGYETGTNPTAINLSKMPTSSPIVVDGTSFSYKLPNSTLYELPAGKEPVAKIGAKYFTTDEKALKSVNIEETPNNGFTNGSQWVGSQPQINDPAYSAVSNGYLKGTQWVGSQPQINDPAYSAVSNGYLKGTQWVGSQPQINDPAYSAVSNGYLKGTQWVGSQPQINDPTYSSVSNGFFKGNQWLLTQPQINDPAYSAVSNGYLKGTQWVGSQPQINDPTYSSVSNGFFKGNQWLLTQPQINDTNYSAVSNGYLKGTQWVGSQPQINDITFHKITKDGSLDNSAAKVWIDTADWKMKSGATLPTSGVIDITSTKADLDDYENQWISQTTTVFSVPDLKSAQPQIADTSYASVSSGFKKSDGTYSSTQPQIADTAYASVSSGFKKADGTYSSTQPQIADTAYASVSSGFKKADGTYSSTQPQIADTAYASVSSGFKKSDGTYSSTQPKIADSSYASVSSGFKKADGTYSSTQPQIADTAYASVSSGFKKADGTYSSTQPQIADTAYASVSSGFKKADGTYSSTQPQIADTSYHSDHAGSYYNTSTKDYYANKSDAKTAEKVLSANNSFTSNSAINVDGSNETPAPASLTKNWYDASDQLVSNKFYENANQANNYKYTTNLKDGKGYVASNLNPSTVTVLSDGSVSTVTIAGKSYTWVPKQAASQSLAIEVLYAG